MSPGRGRITYFDFENTKILNRLYFCKGFKFPLDHLSEISLQLVSEIIGQFYQCKMKKRKSSLAQY